MFFKEIISIPIFSYLINQMKYPINLVDENIFHVNKLLFHNLKRKHNKIIFRTKNYCGMIHEWFKNSRYIYPVDEKDDF